MNITWPSGALATETPLAPASSTVTFSKITFLVSFLPMAQKYYLVISYELLVMSFL
jgi:hypothetical protein